MGRNASRLLAAIIGTITVANGVVSAQAAAAVTPTVPGGVATSTVSAPATVAPPPAATPATHGERAADAATRAWIFLPFHVTGLRESVTVTERASARCFAGSLSSAGRPDAWRCNSGDRIYDPCFEGAQDERTVLLCVDTPWSDQALLLTPTHAPPRGEANPANLTGALPWSIELANGARCELLTGATSVSAGLRVNYWCDGEASVIGDIDREQPRWQVFFVSAAGTAAERVGVAAVWY